MTRYDIILLFFAILFLAFAGYFGYREWTDPILFPGDEKAQPADLATNEEEATRQLVPTEASKSPSPNAMPDSGPAPDQFNALAPVDPQEIEILIEETLTQQVGQLAALVETRLASSVQSAQDQISAQSEKLASADRIIRQTLDTYQESTRDSVGQLSETLDLINEMQIESESITSSLENARAEWDQLFDDVTAIGERSDDRLAESNFEFQTYTISGAETLSEISRRLESDYNLPESDLSFLLNRFNEIDYRLQDPGGRRPAYRVVANDTLRVPVPKTVGTILKDYALPEKLRSQMTYINQAASANTNLKKSLIRQVDKLRIMEANVQAIASMSETLSQIDLDTDNAMPDMAKLSPEQQVAWQQFETALADYRSASGFEEEQLALNKLEQSITRILKQYEQDYLEASDTESSPLEYYLRFIERYRPDSQ